MNRKHKRKMDKLSSKEGVKPSPFRSQKAANAMKALEEFRQEFWRKKESKKTQRNWNRPQADYSLTEISPTLQFDFPSIRFSDKVLINDTATQLNPLRIIMKPVIDRPTTPKEPGKSVVCEGCCPKFIDFDDENDFYNQYLEEVTVPRLLKAVKEMRASRKLASVEETLDIAGEEAMDPLLKVNKTDPSDTIHESKYDSEHKELHVHTFSSEFVKELTESNMKVTQLEDASSPSARVKELLNDSTFTKVERKKKRSAYTTKFKGIDAEWMDSSSSDDERVVPRRNTKLTKGKKIESKTNESISTMLEKFQAKTNEPAIAREKKATTKKQNIIVSKKALTRQAQLNKLSWLDEPSSIGIKRFMTAMGKGDTASNLAYINSIKEVPKNIGAKKAERIGDCLSATKVGRPNYQKEADVEALRAIPTIAKMNTKLKLEKTGSLDSLVKMIAESTPQEATDYLRPSSANFHAPIMNRCLSGQTAADKSQQFSLTESRLADNIRGKQTTSKAETHAPCRPSRGSSSLESMKYPTALSTSSYKKPQMPLKPILRSRQTPQMDNIQKPMRTWNSSTIIKSKACDTKELAKHNFESEFTRKQRLVSSTTNKEDLTPCSKFSIPPLRYTPDQLSWCPEFWSSLVVPTMTTYKTTCLKPSTATGIKPTSNKTKGQAKRPTTAKL